MRQTRWNGVFAIVLLGLAACSEEQPAEMPRPALVVQPGGGAGAALSAYAGEVRAREESPLAFRVGARKHGMIRSDGTRQQQAAESLCACSAHRLPTCSTTKLTRTGGTIFGDS